MTIAKAIARAWSDEAYKSKLIADPVAALGETGVAVRPGTTVTVVENTPAMQHLVLPAAPSNVDELSTEELEKVAAGMSSGGSDEVSVTPNPQFYVAGGAYQPG